MSSSPVQVFTFCHAPCDNYAEQGGHVEQESDDDEEKEKEPTRYRNHHIGPLTVRSKQRCTPGEQKEAEQISEAHALSPHSAAAAAAFSPSFSPSHYPAIAPAPTPTTVTSACAKPNCKDPSQPTLSSNAVTSEMEEDDDPFNLRRSAPPPRSKTIPPPRNHILTLNALKTRGCTVERNESENTARHRDKQNAQGPIPGALCGFSCTLLQSSSPGQCRSASPSAISPYPSTLLLFGGADPSGIRNELWQLRVEQSQPEWERIEADAGGMDGPRNGLFLHAATEVDGMVVTFGGLTYEDDHDGERSGALCNSMNDQTPYSHSDACNLQPDDEATRSGMVYDEDDVERVELPDEDQGRRPSIAWRMASATGSGIWTLAKLPWKAAKKTGKGLKHVGKAVLHPKRTVQKLYGSSSAITSKAEQYGVEHDEPGCGFITTSDGQRIPVGCKPPSARSQQDDPASTSPTAGYAPLSLSPPTDPTSPRYHCQVSHTSASSSQFAQYPKREVLSNTVYIFDPRRRRWLSDVTIIGNANGNARVPPPRFGHSMVYCARRRCCYVFGGAKKVGYQSATDELWRLDGCSRGAAGSYGSTKLRWTQVHPNGQVPMKRYGHTATMVHDRYMIIFGGMHEEILSRHQIRDPSFPPPSPTRFNDIWLFDTFDESWRRLVTYGMAPSPRAFHSATLIQDASYLAIMGGEGDGGLHGASDLVLLDLRQHVWIRPLCDIPCSMLLDRALFGCVSFPHTSTFVLHAGMRSSNGKLVGISGSPRSNRQAGNQMTVMCNLVEVCGVKDDHTECIVRIFVIGPSRAGKTALIRRFVEDRFVAEENEKILAAALPNAQNGSPSHSQHPSATLDPTLPKPRTVLTLLDGGKLAKIHLYDLPSSLPLSLMLHALHMADAAVLVYDGTSITSIDQLEQLAEQIRTAAAVGPGEATQGRGGAVQEELDSMPVVSSIDAKHEAGTNHCSSHLASFSSSPSTPLSRRLVLSVVSTKSDLCVNAPPASNDLSSLFPSAAVLAHIRRSGRRLSKSLHIRTPWMDTSAVEGGLNIDSVFIGVAKRVMTERKRKGHDHERMSRGIGMGCIIC